MFKMDLGNKIEKMFRETRRIIVLTRKPKKSEFNETVKVTGFGILIMGFLGFLIVMIATIARSI